MAGTVFITFYLYLLCMVQRNPAITVLLVRFQKPPLGCAGAVRFLDNRKDTRARVLSGLGLIGARAFTDTQVRNRHLHQIRLKSGLLPRVDILAGFIEHGIPGILIRTLLRIGKAVERTFLGRCIRPGLTHTVPNFRSSGMAGTAQICTTSFPAVF